MSNRVGYRGYIGSREYRCGRAPQHVQNLVVRDFCRRNGFEYLLSATEYGMDGCYIMLEEVAGECESIQGIVLYSIFMLPQRRARRLAFCERIFAAGATLHGAVENIHLRDRGDLDRLEEIYGVMDVVPTDEALNDVLRNLP